MTLSFRSPWHGSTSSDWPALMSHSTDDQQRSIVVLSRCAYKHWIQLSSSSTMINSTISTSHCHRTSVLNIFNQFDHLKTALLARNVILDWHVQIIDFSSIIIWLWCLHGRYNFKYSDPYTQQLYLSSDSKWQHVTVDLRWCCLYREQWVSVADCLCNNISMSRSLSQHNTAHATDDIWRQVHSKLNIKCKKVCHQNIKNIKLCFTGNFYKSFFKENWSVCICKH